MSGLSSSVETTETSLNLLWMCCNEEGEPCARELIIVQKEERKTRDIYFIPSLRVCLCHHLLLLPSFTTLIIRYSCYWLFNIMCCIYGLSPWRMASVGLMHNLPKMMVIPDSAGDASWVRMHACKGILCTPYIRSWMYLYFRIQASSNQYIST